MTEGLVRCHRGQEGEGVTVLEGQGQVFSVHWVVELGGIAACMVPLHTLCPAGETPHALLGEKKLDVTHIEADTCLSVLSSPLGQL